MSLKKNYVKFTNTKYKTIKEIKQGGYDKDIFVFFTDGTWSLISSEYSRDDYDTIYSYPHYPERPPDIHHAYVAFGIMDIAEHEEMRKQLEFSEERTKRAFRYQQYQNLKKEFDPDQGTGI